MRGAFAGCDFVSPAQLRAAGFRKVAMNYYIVHVPLHDDAGNALGVTEPVVCAHASRQGLTSTTFGVTALLHAFPTVNYVVLCGVAAGVPTPAPSFADWQSTLPAAASRTKADYDRVLLKHGETDVRLGDIVVGDGAIQFDFGKKTMTGFEPRGEPVRACEQMRTVTERLYERMRSNGERPWDAYIEQAIAKTSEHRSKPVKRPKQDKLHRHRIERNEAGDLVVVVSQEAMSRGKPAYDVPKGKPNVFRAKIGSSDMVMKDSLERDKLGRNHRVGALEMEGSAALEAASGIGDCKAIIIRGICDYADPDKNDDWWMYAACAAAGYSRVLVERLHLQIETL